jgi:hypothetical protein
MVPLVQHGLPGMRAKAADARNEHIDSHCGNDC